MTIPQTCEVEFSVLVDGDGEFVISKDECELANIYEADVGSMPNVSRVYTFKMILPLPKAVNVGGMVPDTDEPVTITVS